MSWSGGACGTSFSTFGGRGRNGSPLLVSRLHVCPGAYSFLTMSREPGLNCSSIIWPGGRNCSHPVYYHLLEKKNFFPSRMAVQSKARIKSFPFYYYTVHFCLRLLMPKKQNLDIQGKTSFDSWTLLWYPTDPKNEKAGFHTHMWTRRCSKPNGQGPIASQAP